MAKASFDDYQAARATLGEGDFTKAGEPKMDAINSALAAVEIDPIDADARDAFEAELAEYDPTEDAPEEEVTLTLTDAPTNPLPLYVHGVGRFSLRQGEEVTLPIEAVDALRNSNAKFTIKEAANG